MAFEVRLLPSAQMDLEEAFDYYNQINWSSSKKIYSEFIALHTLLQQNPFFEIKYHTVRTYKLKSFPYVVHFVVNENSGIVTIIAIAYGNQEKVNFGNRFPIV